MLIKNSKNNNNSLYKNKVSIKQKPKKKLQSKTCPGSKYDKFIIAYEVFFSISFKRGFYNYMYKLQ